MREPESLKERCPVTRFWEEPSVPWLFRWQAFAWTSGSYWNILCRDAYQWFSSIHTQAFIGQILWETTENLHRNPLLWTGTMLNHSGGRLVLLRSQNVRSGRIDKFFPILQTCLHRNLDLDTLGSVCFLSPLSLQRWTLVGRAESFGLWEDERLCCVLLILTVVRRHPRGVALSPWWLAILRIPRLKI